MLKVLLISCLIVFVFADNKHINEDLVNDIKSKTDKWIPHEVNENPLKDKTHEQLHMFLGAKLRPPLGSKMPPSENADIPKTFDGREQWPNCIHPIRN
jgi:hypothetical protein